MQMWPEVGCVNVPIHLSFKIYIGYDELGPKIVFLDNFKNSYFNLLIYGYKGKLQVKTQENGQKQ